MDYDVFKCVGKLQKLLDKISEGVILHENFGLILWVNDRAAEILAKPKEELIGKNIETFLPLKTRSNNSSYNIKTNDKLPMTLEIEEVIIQEEPHQINAVLLKNNKLLLEDKVKLKSIEIRKEYEEYKGFNINVKHGFKDIIGENQQFVDMKILAQRAALSSSPILIYGETGTGKELLAQSIHSQSSRSHMKFIAMNCAAIPEHLLESIFFGTTKGSYTGAVDRPGLFELASEGTIFLDEINSMPLALQSKLLRVIQEGNVRRVGGKNDIVVNPRVISAINVDPIFAIENNLMRGDLFYRLGVVCIRIPPLRDRKDDIPILANYFMKKICKKLDRPYMKISQDVLEFFYSYNWPGNVRQLEYVIEGVLILMPDDEFEILLEHLPEYLRVTSSEVYTKVTSKQKTAALQDEIDKIERNKIIAALEETDGNITMASRKLQISRESLYYRMKKFNITLTRAY